MQKIAIATRETKLSLVGASKWLNERGIPPTTRNALYRFIASGDLVAKQIMPRVWQVKLRDLEAFGQRQKAKRL